MTTKEYNGWTNYETWLVKLWIDNEEASCVYWRGEAQGAFESASSDQHFTQVERAVLDLAKQLQAEHEELLPDAPGFITDLLNAAMSEVNWHEIAASLVDSAVEATATTN